jgi:uncharacterized membrane protein YccF (DUF307 family)
MSVISLLLNLLWIIFGGLWMALGWVIAAVVIAITRLQTLRDRNDCKAHVRC